MDELDVRIFRALISENAVAPSDTQVSSSLRSIAARIGADDMTVNYRYKRLERSGALEGWQLVVNPGFFGCRLMDVTVDVQPESAKPDMMRQLRLVHEVVGMFDFYGRALKLVAMLSGEESRSRVTELISRITSAERVVRFRWALPPCRAERLTETDVAIIRALSKDARRSFVQVSKELSLSTRTVRNRVARLRRENVVFTIPTLNMGGIPGLIPAYLSYSYSRSDEKRTVDRAMLSHFESSHISLGLTDPDSAFIVLSASTMNEVREQLEWARSQPGVADARSDLLVKTLMFPEKLVELLGKGGEKRAMQRKVYA